MDALSEKELSALRKQFLKANEITIKIVRKSDNSDKTTKEIQTVVSEIQDQIIFQEKKVTDIDIVEFTNFYLIKFYLTAFQYTLDNQPVTFD